MPDGSSSAAPVMRPGPSSEQNVLTKPRRFFGSADPAGTAVSLARRRPKHRRTGSAAGAAHERHEISHAILGAGENISGEFAIAEDLVVDRAFHAGVEREAGQVLEAEV